MLLVLSTTWIELRNEGNNNTKLRSVFVHKGINFEAGGSTYLDVFTPPRRTTFLLNLLTAAATEGDRNDGAKLTEIVDCPTSSSAVLSNPGERFRTLSDIETLFVDFFQLACSEKMNTRTLSNKGR